MATKTKPGAAKTKTGTRKKSKRGAKPKKKPAKKRAGKCFVLMPFEEPFDTYYTTIIRPAVTAAGLEPLRGDSLFRPAPIMADIWSMIQSAKVLVAELTGKNANVFYELGLAHAVGNPIVLISETMDDVPFDLQPLRVIVYEKDNPAWGNKLRNNMTSSLKENVSEPINSVPTMFRKKVKSQAPEESILSLRLAALERQVASMGDSIPSKHPRDLVNWYGRKVRDTRNRGEAGIVTSAVIGRLPPSVIQSILSDRLGATEARQILKTATVGGLMK